MPPPTSIYPVNWVTSIEGYCAKTSEANCHKMVSVYPEPFQINRMIRWLVKSNSSSRLFITRTRRIFSLAMGTDTVCRLNTDELQVTPASNVLYSIPPT